MKNLKWSKTSTTNISKTYWRISQKYNLGSFTGLKVTENYHKDLQQHANKEDKNALRNLKNLSTKPFIYNEGKVIYNNYRWESLLYEPHHKQW